MEDEIKTPKKEKIPTEEEIENHNKLDETWCKNCQEFVYNFKKKRHCPKCGSLL